jgi:hypothetical protein
MAALNNPGCTKSCKALRSMITQYEISEALDTDYNGPAHGELAELHININNQELNSFIEKSKSDLGSINEINQSLENSLLKFSAIGKFEDAFFNGIGIKIVNEFLSRSDEMLPDSSKVTWFTFEQSDDQIILTGIGKVDHYIYILRGFKQQRYLELKKQFMMAHDEFSEISETVLHANLQTEITLASEIKLTFPERMKTLISEVESSEKFRQSGEPILHWSFAIISDFKEKKRVCIDEEGYYASDEFYQLYLIIHYYSYKYN